jgi:hypothetical protein
MHLLLGERKFAIDYKTMTALALGPSFLICIHMYNVVED